MRAPAENAGDARTLAPDDPRHGTANGYSNLSCRCSRCREAWRVAHRDWRHRSGYTVPRDDYLYIVRRSAELRDNHGTETRYKLGCRCDACRAASADARRKNRHFGTVSTHNRNGYGNGCRCEVCREAQRVYTAERRASARLARSVRERATKPERGCR